MQAVDWNEEKINLMGVASEKLCLQNNIFVIRELSFTWNTKEGVLIGMIKGIELKTK